MPWGVNLLFKKVPMFTLKKELPIIEEVPLLLGSLEVAENTLGPHTYVSFFRQNFHQIST
jgi:hypothetical protein